MEMLAPSLLPRLLIWNPCALCSFSLSGSSGWRLVFLNIILNIILFLALNCGLDTRACSCCHIVLGYLYRFDFLAFGLKLLVQYQDLGGGLIVLQAIWSMLPIHGSLVWEVSGQLWVQNSLLQIIKGGWNFDFYLFRICTTAWWNS